MNETGSTLVPKEPCVCCNIARQAACDLDMACNRILTSHVFDQKTKDWLEAYRNGVAAVLNRIDKTGGIDMCRNNKEPKK